MRRMLIATILVWTAMTVGPFVSDAAACPMCKEANEADDRRPAAYMYSILIMLAMPVTIFTGFGVSFYRLSKKQAGLNNDRVLSPEDENIAGESPDDLNE